MKGSNLKHSHRLNVKVVFEGAAAVGAATLPLFGEFSQPVGEEYAA
jgi:hypothetical protein